MCILKRARRIHRSINKRCFNGELPSIKFKHTRISGLCGGFQGEFTCYNGDIEKSYIAINAIYHKELFDTVAHETVHQFQHITKGFELGHGGDFIALCCDNDFMV